MSEMDLGTGSTANNLIRVRIGSDVNTTYLTYMIYYKIFIFWSNGLKVLWHANLKYNYNYIYIWLDLKVFQTYLN